MDDLDVVQSLAGGNFVADLARELRDMTERALALGRKGKITVSIDVEPKGGLVPAVLIDTEIVGKPPKGDKQPAMFFFIRGQMEKHDPRQAQMEKHDPRQAQMEYRNVDGTPELRAVEAVPAQRRDV